jgi:hypothetical protein
VKIARKSTGFREVRWGLHLGHLRGLRAEGVYGKVDAREERLEN